jgi:hypothetical protein
MQRLTRGIGIFAAPLLMAILGAAAALAEPAADPAAACHRAALAAEKRHGIPVGLLQAIGQIESGRQDGSAGRVAAWPWTISAEGRGRYFPSRDEALAEVTRLRERGVESIDVGCMQINLYFHAAAFRDLADAFAPDSNADYAARFLKSLFAETGDWHEAVGRYHSATPKRKRAYTEKVMAVWMPERSPQAPPTLPAGFGELSPADYRTIMVAQYLARRAAKFAVD